MVQPKTNNKERHQIQTTASQKKKNYFVSANIQVAITKCHQSDAAKRMYKTLYCMICSKTYKQQKQIERILIMA